VRPRQLGRYGESVVASYIQQQLGWTIVEQNWRCREGEIDIIAYDGDELVFIEVRARRGKYAEQKIFESIGPRKRERLFQLALSYFHHLDQITNQTFRFDVFGVIVESDDSFTIKHMRDALEW